MLGLQMVPSFFSFSSTALNRPSSLQMLRLHSELEVLREFDHKRQEQVAALSQELASLRSPKEQRQSGKPSAEVLALTAELNHIQAAIAQERRTATVLRGQLQSALGQRAVMLEEEALRQALTSILWHELMQDVFVHWAGMADAAMLPQAPVGRRAVPASASPVGNRVSPPPPSPPL